MGLVGLLRFTLLFLDFLSWPAFAQVYLIWASIRAIETGSKYHMKKLVTYWTIFSIISLLEHTLKLFQWVPFWPYIKLIAICWMMIPRFDGACHVYQCLLHPCLSLNRKTVVNWFCEKASIKDPFLTTVEHYLKENGSEALEKLILSKVPGNYHMAKCKEDHVTDVDEDTKRLEPTEINVAAEEPVLLYSNVADAQEDMERVEPIEKNVAAEEQWEHMERVEPIQKNLAAEEHWLLYSNVADAQEDIERVEPIEKNVAAEEQWLLHSNVADAQEDMERVEPIQKNVVAEEQWVKHPQENLSKTENKTSIAAEVPHVSMSAATEEKGPSEIPAVKQIQREWTCAVCQVTVTSEATLNSHLKGEKHKSKCAELKTVIQIAKNKHSLPVRATETNHGNKKSNNCQHGEKRKQNLPVKQENVHVSGASAQHKQRRSQNAGVDSQHSKVWCAICNIWCYGDIHLAAHLNGRKHLNQVQSLFSSISGVQA